MRRFLIIISILILAVVFNHYPSCPASIPSREPLKDFPSRIGDWSIVSTQRMNQQSLAVLKVDDYIMRTYRNSTGHTVSLYIGYFKTQEEGKTNHSPRQCLAGAGWGAVGAASVKLRVMNRVEIPVNKYLMENGGDRELFLFWYQGRGRVTASEYLTKVYLMWDSIEKHRTDGALVRLNSKVFSSPEEAFVVQTNFARALYPLLSKYIPN